MFFFLDRIIRDELQYLCSVFRSAAVLPEYMGDRMNHSDTLRSRLSLWGIKALKGLFLYALVPLLCLVFLAKPAGDAVRGSDSAAFWILLAVFCAVCLNWVVYAVLRRKCPSLLVFSHGVFCLLLTVIVEAEALPGSYGLTSTLAVIGGCLALIWLFLLSFWCASVQSKPAHAAAVVLWCIIAAVSVFMAYGVIRDAPFRNPWSPVVTRRFQESNDYCRQSARHFAD